MHHAQALANALAADVRDARVLAAIARVPRELFVPAQLRERAYDNVALPIGHGQTISQPVVVARMLELLALTGSERVLDVGTGSGYHAALLGLLAREVVSIELVPELSAAAARRLAALGIDDVRCRVADGWSPALEAGERFDAINVAAAARAIPDELIEALAPEGRIVAPVGGRRQRLCRVSRRADGSLREELLDPVTFVPLVRAAAE